MYKYAKLRGRIIEKYGSMSNFARAVEISTTALSKKMTCKTGISQSDIEKWSKMLDILENEYGDFYFS